MGPRWEREVGSWPYLKNLRKGLRYQQEQCEKDLRNAVDAATADPSAKRLQWIINKQCSLYIYGVIVSDSQDHPRFLTDQEIRWNAWFARRVATAFTHATPAMQVDGAR